MSLSDNTFARLRSQMERAELVLFTGAGFSLGARVLVPLSRAIFRKGAKARARQALQRQHEQRT